MKDFLKTLIPPPLSDVAKRNRVREYLQARLLQSFQKSGAFQSWSFLGGTALRFVHNIQRYSEDLDFSLHGAESQRPSFSDIVSKAKAALEAENYKVEVKINEQRTVINAHVKFRGLLAELGISRRAQEVLMIKIDLDTNPPLGARIESSIISRHVIMNISHHDRASLLAGKIHALLMRSYTKGRDWYDLMWYLTGRDWPTPNFDFLNAALNQTGWQGGVVNEENWKNQLLSIVDRTEWEQVRVDVEPFLEDAHQSTFLTSETFHKLLA